MYEVKMELTPLFLLQLSLIKGKIVKNAFENNIGHVSKRKSTCYVASALLKITTINRNFTAVFVQGAVWRLKKLLLMIRFGLRCEETDHLVRCL
jgi:hypothetical protein